MLALALTRLRHHLAWQQWASMSTEISCEHLPIAGMAPCNGLFQHRSHLLVKQCCCYKQDSRSIFNSIILPKLYPRRLNSSHMHLFSALKREGRNCITVAVLHHSSPGSLLVTFFCSTIPMGVGMLYSPVKNVIMINIQSLPCQLSIKSAHSDPKISPSAYTSGAVTTGCNAARVQEPGRRAAYSGRAEVIHNAVALIHIRYIRPGQCQHTHKLQWEAQELHSAFHVLSDRCASLPTNTACNGVTVHLPA